MRITALLCTVALLSACNISVADKDSGNTATPAGGQVQTGQDTSLAFADAEPLQGQRESPNPILWAQVVLDRLGFSPGVIDSRQGQSFKAALSGFQASRNLQETGKLDEKTRQALQHWKDVPATRWVTIPQAFVDGPYVPKMPKDPAAQAKLPAMAYRDLMEKLAERFHTTPEALAALNAPNTRIGAGKVIRVPNVANVDPSKLGKDERNWNRTLQILAVAPDQPEVAKVVVDKSEGVLKAYDADDWLVAQFPATMGSEHDPLPLGRWKITGISKNPDFHYNPKLFWDVSDAKQEVSMKPGPNGPVGVVWIDLSKEHYGIHGTGEPQTIGRAESHGCIRLTNWDAARLAQMVKSGVPAIFQE
jgi:lipoprotein-anchoring transpeptidase ErfK/SrfK